MLSWPITGVWHRFFAYSTCPKASTHWNTKTSCISWKPLTLERFNWFKLYLLKRPYFTALYKPSARLVSNSRTIFRGVPQDSILGPTCFNLFLADLVDLSLRYTAKMYADNTQIVFYFRPDDFAGACASLNKDLQCVSHRASANVLLLNCAKSEFLVINPTGRHRTENIYNINLSVDG